MGKRRAPPLQAPVNIAKWWLTSGGVAGRLRLFSHGDRHLVELARLNTKAGCLVSGVAAFVTEVKHLERLQKSIGKAITKVIELGLLP